MDSGMFALIAALIGVIGIATGAILSGAIQLIWQEYKYFKERKSLAISISAEIMSLIKIIVERRICWDLLDWINFFRRQPQDTVWTKRDTCFYSITFNYFLIFDSNTGKLGMLGEKLAGEITGLYTISKGVAEDLKDQSPREIRRDGMIAWFSETLFLAVDCLEKGLVIRGKLKQISHQGFLEYLFRMLLPG